MMASFSWLKVLVVIIGLTRDASARAFAEDESGTIILKDGPELKPILSGDMSDPGDERQTTYYPPKENMRAIPVLCNGSPVSVTGSSVTNPVVVASPNYPGNYADNTNCDYTVNVPAGVDIRIDIQSMETECDYDYFTLSLNNQQPPALNTCPTSALAPAYSVVAQPLAYTLNFKFISDFSVTFPGGRFNIYATNTAPPTKCTCGVFTTNRELTSEAKDEAFDDEGERIVGGTFAAPHAFPYQVGLWFVGATSPRCGGTLISTNYILTAAHCVVGFPASVFRVAIGDVDYTTSTDGEVFINVASIVIHPNYNTQTQDQDFALLRLASPAPIRASFSGIACLPPTTSQLFANVNLVITGWGTTSLNGPPSPRLKVATVKSVTNAVCNPFYNNQITGNMICAGAPGTDTCQGDSGGPMVTAVNNKVTVVGVTSFGDGCAKPGVPGVYSRVTAQKAWILANSDAGSCQN